MTSNGSWTTLPLEIAKRHALFGVAGWLYLVAIGCIVTPLRAGASLGPIYAGIDYAALHPTLSAFIMVEIFVNVVVILWAIANLFLLFGKHRFFPRSYAGMLGFSAVVVVGDTVVTKYVMDAMDGRRSGARSSTQRRFARSAAQSWRPRYGYLTRSSRGG